MNETPFFFEREGAELFGLYHEPAAAPRLPFLFCHPFGEEKLWTHRVHVQFARELARRGHPVLRFDYAGNGDSSGTFAESSLETALADIDAAAAVLQQRSGQTRIGLLGMRLGGSLAFTAAARRRDVDALVLWAPIVEGSQYLQELLRINLTTQMAVYREVREDREALTGRLLGGAAVVNVDGYDIAPAMGRQLDALSLVAGEAPTSVDALIVQIERSDKARPAADLARVAERLPRAELRLVQEEPFWKEIKRFYDTAPNLFAATLTWLERAR